MSYSNYGDSGGFDQAPPSAPLQGGWGIYDQENGRANPVDSSIAASGTLPVQQESQPTDASGRRLTRSMRPGPQEVTPGTRSTRRSARVAQPDKRQQQPHPKRKSTKRRRQSSRQPRDASGEGGWQLPHLDPMEITFDSEMLASSSMDSESSQDIPGDFGSTSFEGSSPEDEDNDLFGVPKVVDSFHGAISSIQALGIGGVEEDAHFTPPCGDLPAVATDAACSSGSGIARTQSTIAAMYLEPDPPLPPTVALTIDTTVAEPQPFPLPSEGPLSMDTMQDLSNQLPLDLGPYMEDTYDKEMFGLEGLPQPTPLFATDPASSNPGQRSDNLDDYLDWTPCREQSCLFGNRSPSREQAANNGGPQGQVMPGRMAGAPAVREPFPGEGPGNVSIDEQFRVPGSQAQVRLRRLGQKPAEVARASARMGAPPQAGGQLLATVDQDVSLGEPGPPVALERPPELLSLKDGLSLAPPQAPSRDPMWGSSSGSMPPPSSRIAADQRNEGQGQRVSANSAGYQTMQQGFMSFLDAYSEWDFSLDDPPPPDFVLSKVPADLARKLTGPNKPQWFCDEFHMESPPVYAACLHELLRKPQRTPVDEAMESMPDILTPQSPLQVTPRPSQARDVSDVPVGRLLQVKKLADACKSKNLWNITLDEEIEDFFLRDFVAGNEFVQAATFLDILSYFWGMRCDDVYSFAMEVAGSLRSCTKEIAGRSGNEEGGSKRRKKPMGEIDESDLVYVPCASITSKKEVTRTRDSFAPLPPSRDQKYYLAEPPKLIARQHCGEFNNYIRHFSESTLIAGPFLHYPETVTEVKRVGKNIGEERAWREAAEGEPTRMVDESGRPVTPDGKKQLAIWVQKPRAERLVGQHAVEESNVLLLRRGIEGDIIEEAIEMIERKARVFTQREVAMEEEELFIEDKNTEETDEDDDEWAQEALMYLKGCVPGPRIPAPKGCQSAFPNRTIPPPAEEIPKMFSHLCERDADLADELVRQVVEGQKASRGVLTDFHPDLWPESSVHPTNRNAIWMPLMNERLSSSAFLPYDFGVEGSLMDPDAPWRPLSGQFPSRIVVDAFEKEVLRVDSGKDGPTGARKKPDKKKKEDLSEKRVKRFMSKIEKAVHQDWQKSEMDFQNYAQKILDVFNQAPFNVEGEFPFEALCSKWQWTPENKDPSEICRIFITTLNLASSGNIELQGPSADGEEEAVYGEDGRLLPSAKFVGVRLKDRTLRRDVLATLSGSIVPPETAEEAAMEASRNTLGFGRMNDDDDLGKARKEPERQVLKPVLSRDRLPPRSEPENQAQQSMSPS